MTMILQITRQNGINNLIFIFKNIQKLIIQIKLENNNYKYNTIIKTNILKIK